MNLHLSGRFSRPEAVDALSCLAGREPSREDLTNGVRRVRSNTPGEMSTHKGPEVILNTRLSVTATVQAVEDTAFLNYKELRHGLRSRRTCGVHTSLYRLLQDE